MMKTAGEHLDVRSTAVECVAAGQWQPSETFCATLEHDTRCTHYLLIICGPFQYFHSQKLTFNTLLVDNIKLCPPNKHVLRDDNF